MEDYDSTVDTLKHIKRVNQLLLVFAGKLLERAVVHDESKLNEPEKSGFDRATPKLRGLTYGSDEYKAALAELNEALTHHYTHNSHHPEFYGYSECNGCFKKHPKSYEAACDVCGYTQFTFRPDIKGMNLLDIVEMFFDWKAATERHTDGDIMRSIEHNKGRFSYGDDLAAIFRNTVESMDLK